MFGLVSVLQIIGNIHQYISFSEIQTILQNSWEAAGRLGSNLFSNFISCTHKMDTHVQGGKFSAFQVELKPFEESKVVQFWWRDFVWVLNNYMMDNVKSFGNLLVKESV